MVDAIDDWLAQGHERYLTFVGKAEVGKTALAVCWPTLALSL